MKRTISPKEYPDYPKHEKTIIGKAFHFSSINNYEIDPDFLIAEGNTIFINAHEDFNPQLSNFNTWLTLKLDQQLSIICQKELNYKNIPIDIGYSSCSNPLKSTQLNIMVESLSKESKEIIYMIFDPSNDFKNFFRQLHVCKDTLKFYLKSRGWKYNIIEKCFKEIGIGLKEEM